MAWSWSHTDEAITNAYVNLREFSRETLMEILAEWRMHERGIPDSDWPREYPGVIHLIRHHNYTHAKLVSAVWRRVRVFQTCDEGGFNAWMCPYGCEWHCVSFGAIQKSEAV